MLCKLCIIITIITTNPRYVKYIGSLFLNMLKSVIIPLVIPSLISAIGEHQETGEVKVGDEEEKHER